MGKYELGIMRQALQNQLALIGGLITSKQVATTWNQ